MDAAVTPRVTIVTGDVSPAVKRPGERASALGGRTLRITLQRTAPAPQPQGESAPPTVGSGALEAGE